MEKLGKGTVILVHGLLSSPERTSLRNTEQYYRQLGYDVQYIEYNSLIENPTQEIIWKADAARQPGQEVIVIGHSLGGKYVSTASKAYPNKEIYYYTVNSPWSESSDGAVDLKHTMDWSNVLAFFNDPMALVSSKFTRGAHSVGTEQVVRW